MAKEDNGVKYCILIPAYNESGAIGRLVSRLKGEGREVVVIDDGSRDDTANIARDSGAFVLSRPVNKGKGAALKDGFQYAVSRDYDAVIIMDGDGQHDPTDIDRMVEAADSTGADLVMGNRMEDTTSMPWLRKLTNRVLSGYISGVCGQPIPDTQCGFRLIKSRLLREINLISSKYETESEIIIRAAQRKFKIDSIPVKTIYGAEQSAIHPVKDALRSIRLILTMKFERFFKA